MLFLQILPQLKIFHLNKLRLIQKQGMKTTNLFEGKNTPAYSCFSVQRELTCLHVGQVNQLLHGQFEGFRRALERKLVEEVDDEIVNDLIEADSQLLDLGL